MIHTYRIHEQGITNEGYKLGYIERTDNYLFIAQGYIITYEQWLTITDYEKSIVFRIISLYQHEDGSIIILGCNDSDGKHYIVKQPL